MSHVSSITFNHAHKPSKRKPSLKIGRFCCTHHSVPSRPAAVRTSLLVPTVIRERLAWLMAVFFKTFRDQLRCTWLFAGVLGLGLSAISSRADSIVLGIVGDFGAAVEGAASASNELAVANLIKRWNPDFVLTLGDNNYPSGAAATIDVNVGQFYHEFIAPYLGVYGSGAESNRFFPCLGNHDWVQEGQPSIDYFTLPGNERYYRYQASPYLEWFALNSNPDDDGTSPTSVQGIWLRNALTNSSARWKIVYFHHPPYSADAGAAGNSYMRWPFAAWGATMVLAGHDHVYARIHTNGLPYIINGLGGDDIHALGSPAAGIVSRFNSDFGAMRMEATATNLVTHFITRRSVVVDTLVLGDPIANPFILESPASRTVSAGRTVQFTVQAIGSPPPRYQWLSNSIPLPNATNRTLTFPNVQASDEADYAVVVTCGSVSIRTRPAQLSILRHPLITTQPISQTVKSGLTAIFRVAAESAGVLRCQWRFNGVDLPGATSTNLVLTNITPASAGAYAALLTDDVGSILSATATLTVLARPVVTQHPIGQTAVVGDTVVWSVTADGTLPMGYSWRQDGRIITNILVNSSTCFWAISNIQWTNAGNYQVGITNAAGPASRLTSNAFLVVLEDRDNDHLPDTWETQFGFDPDDSSDAGLDADQDGVSNLDERLAGTDPLARDSRLRLQLVDGLETGECRMEFLAVSNRTYAVEISEDALNGPWRLWIDFSAAETNRVLSAVVTSPMDRPERRFYRLVTPRLP